MKDTEWIENRKKALKELEDIQVKMGKCKDRLEALKYLTEAYKFLIQTLNVWNVWIHSIELAESIDTDAFYKIVTLIITIIRATIIADIEAVSHIDVPESLIPEKNGENKRPTMYNST